MSVLKAVIDTNVWVSAYLSPTGTPSKLLKAFSDRRLLLVYSPDIEAEYREVLYRDKFAISRLMLAEFMWRLEESGLRILPPPLIDEHLPDPDDAPFIATARHAHCLLVTGNAKHFPPEACVAIISPAEALVRLAA